MSEEKSLPASQKKLRDARKEGQFARTPDAATWLGIAGGAAVTLAGVSATLLVPVDGNWRWMLVLMILPALLLFFPLYAALRRVKVYEEFVEGAKEGFGVATRIELDARPSDAIAIATKITSASSRSVAPAFSARFTCASMHHGHCVMCAMPSAATLLPSRNTSTPPWAMM